MIIIASFCDDNNLRYFLAYGTLIGAVRHKGFIPWDDDIDIHMPKPDYNKFIELYNRNKKIKYYSAVIPSEARAKHSYVKVIDERTVKIEQGVKYKNNFLGIDIDIFPLDGQSDNMDEFCIQYNKVQKLYKRYRRHFIDINYYNKNKNIVSKTILKIKSKILTTFDSKKDISLKWDSIYSEYKYDESKYVGSIASIYNTIEDRYLKKWFDDSVKIEFEGEFFTAPKGYDDVLKTIYGDYMKLPPVEQQITHHSNVNYWK